MPQIFAVTEEMKARAGKIGAGAGEILSSQQSVTGIFQNLGRDFSGRIPSLMTEKMIAMEDIYSGINETLTGYKTFLEETAQSYDWTDAEAAKWAANLGN
ncbi:MAG: hypothetical protein II954_01545 [Synergistaceae bacterium]|nr:hypothetical protein [Synergistaceae bacterium]